MDERKRDGDCMIPLPSRIAHISANQFIGNKSTSGSTIRRFLIDFMATYAHAYTGKIVPVGIKNLSNHMGIGERTSIACLTALVSMNLLIKTKQGCRMKGNVSEYDFNFEAFEKLERSNKDAKSACLEESIGADTALISPNLYPISADRGIPIDAKSACIDFSVDKSASIGADTACNGAVFDSIGADNCSIGAVSAPLQYNTNINTNIGNVTKRARETSDVFLKNSDLIKTAKQPVSNCKRMLDRYNKPIATKAKDPEVEIHTEIQLEEVPEHHVSSANDRRAQDLESVQRCVEDAINVLMGKSYECKAMHKGYDRGLREPSDLRYMKLHNPGTRKVRH